MQRSRCHGKTSGFTWGTTQIQQWYPGKKISSSSNFYLAVNERRERKHKWPSVLSKSQDKLTSGLRCDSKYPNQLLNLSSPHSNQKPEGECRQCMQGRTVIFLAITFPKMWERLHYIFLYNHVFIFGDILTFAPPAKRIFLSHEPCFVLISKS